MPTQSYTYAGFQTDTAVDKQRPGYGRGATNVRVLPGYVDWAMGNRLLSTALPSGTNTAVDAIYDAVGRAVLALVYNSAGNHSITRLDLRTQSVAVLLTWPGLNLPDTRGKTQGGVLGNLLLFLDAGGIVRNVNLTRAQAGEYTPARLLADPYSLHLVKRPPTSNRPIAQRRTGTGQFPEESLRIIQGKAYQFACRWRYEDAEVTVLSPFSEWLDINTPPATTTTNYIQLTLPTAPAGVAEVDVLVREPDSLLWMLATTLRRTAGVLPVSYRFYGITNGTVLSSTEATRPYESAWPAKALGIARDRVFIGNLRIGYPTPEPAFTAALVSGDATTVAVQDVYEFTYQTVSNGDVTTRFILESGAYPDANSTYLIVLAGPNNTFVVLQHSSTTYSQAFDSAQRDEVSPPVRTTTVLPAQTVSSTDLAVRTLHENTTYRVTTQFYDATGAPYGCGSPVTVQVPRQNYAAPENRSLALAMTTTGVQALNTEIPEGADSFQFLLARNDKAVSFIEGRAADTLAYLGITRTIKSDGTTEEKKNLVNMFTPHEKLWVDIGNFPAAGLGYTWQRGDVLRFLDDNVEFPITGQYGDYVEVQWNGTPSGKGNSLIEIYTPNTTSSDVYFERGPRIPILRANGNRSYGQTTVSVEGDCFLVTLSFPAITVFSAKYPQEKTYVNNPVGPDTVESMVPAGRLVPSLTTTQVTTLTDTTKRGVLDGGLFGLISQSNTTTASSTTVASAADTVARTSTSLKWLDIGYGGRPGLRLPTPLQQVVLPVQIAFSSTKTQNTQINGLSEWAGDAIKDLPSAERGGITALRVASQTQAEGTVLLALQERGGESLYLGKVPIASADGTNAFTALSDLVIGSTNALQGGYGTRHPASVASDGSGALYFWDGDMGEPCRYARDGVTPLASTYACVSLFRWLARTYEAANVAAAYDPIAEEYIMFFSPVGDLPGYTVAFSEKHKAFTSDYTLRPDVAVGTGLELVAAASGQLWMHDEEAPAASFFDVLTPPSLLLEVDPAPGLGKDWVSLSQDADQAWGDVALTTERGGVSRLLPEWFDRTSGFWQAPIHCDETTPGMSAVEALYGGEPLHSTTLTMRLTAVPTVPAARPALRTVLVTYSVLNDQLIGPR